MDVRPIHTEADYDSALAEIAPYFQHEPEPGTPDADRFDVLATLIAAYEREHWPIDPPDAVDAIRYRMEQAGYTQADLAKLVGSRPRASEILNRKRGLTMDMAWKLHREWNIPAECLIRSQADDESLRVTFKPISYKQMTGFYVRATWPDGKTLDIDDNSTSGPAFRTEAEADAWIANDSAGWLKRWLSAQPPSAQDMASRAKQSSQ